MQTIPPSRSPFQDAWHQTYPGKRFQKRYLRAARLIFDKSGTEAAMASLAGKAEEEVATFQPPVKGIIIAQSRPFEEWPLYLASRTVQDTVNASTEDVVRAWDAAKLVTKDKQTKFFEATGTPNHFPNVQAMGFVFNNAINRFLGVIQKVTNRNEKKQKIADRRNAKRLEEGLEAEPNELKSATDETGHLLSPPGINHSIYVYQQASPRAYDPDAHANVVLPPEYEGYRRDPDAVIPVGVLNRLAIPKSNPGYVPEWQRGSCKRDRSGVGKPMSMNTHKRMRRYWPDAHAKAMDALLVVIKIGIDWVVVDLRANLRNARWRDLAKRETTLNELLELFTGNPVLDTKRGIATFTYKPESVNIVGRKPVHGSRTKDLLLKLTAPRDGAPREVVAVSVDLGQTLPIAATICRIGQAGGELTRSPVLAKVVLPEELLGDVRGFRNRYDRMEAELRQASTLLLTPEQQAEVSAADTFSETVAKTLLCSQFGLDPALLPWEKMGGYTTYISEAILANGGSEDAVFFVPQKSTTRVLRKDTTWGKTYKPRLSTETRLAKNEREWGLRRTSPEYQKLAKSKSEIGRRCANYLVNTAKTLAKGDAVVIVIEDLNAPFFHGYGKREEGWRGFFNAKHENRWFIQVNHKSLSELAPHRGAHLLEAWPARTSITCPECGHCDKQNRNGVKFVCLKCGEQLHADLDVATHNILTVALTGKSMPKSESPGGVQTPVTTRKRKSAKPSRKTTSTALSPAVLAAPTVDLSQIGAQDLEMPALSV